MEPMTPNYMLGLAALIISFAVLFYVPIAYFLVKVRQQKRKQNKSCWYRFFYIECRYTSAKLNFAYTD